MHQDHQLREQQGSAPDFDGDWLGQSWDGSYGACFQFVCPCPDEALEGFAFPGDQKDVQGSDPRTGLPTGHPVFRMTAAVERHPMHYLSGRVSRWGATLVGCYLRH